MVKSGGMEEGRLHLKSQMKSRINFWEFTEIGVFLESGEFHRNQREQNTKEHEQEREGERERETD